MKILFLFPLNEPFEVITNAGKELWKAKLNSAHNIKKLDFVYPTGLLAIASYVKSAIPGSEIRILDCNVVLGRLAVESPERLHGLGRDKFHELCAASLPGFTPDLIGISALFCSNYGDLHSFASFWKKRFPQALMTAGGHLPAAIYRKIFADGTPLNAICFGEGELPIRDLVQAMKRGEAEAYLAHDAAWITPEKAETPAFAPERRLIENLDEIPPFDFDMLLFPDVYYNSSRYFFVIESSSELREMFIFSTRGCPHHCVFCASQNVHGHKVRKYSLERIKSDILYYSRKFGVSRFIFYDDHFLVYKQRAIDILNFIADSGLRAEIPTPAFFAIDDAVAAAMRRAGIREVNITIESGNADTLRNIIHKPADLRIAERAVEVLHRHGIMAITNILIGIPGETPESIESGIRYLESTDINWFQCFVTAPLPGSELWGICEKNGYFATSDPYVMDFKKCVIRTPDFTPDFIERKVYEMNLRLNFVHNRDMRVGDYAGALKIFERILNTVIDTHAFAWYYAAKCARELGNREKYLVCRDKYYEMAKRFVFWREWIAEFALPDLEEWK